MKSIIRTKLEKMLLTVNISQQENNKLADIMRSVGGVVKAADKDDGNEKLGYLLGFGGFSASGKEKLGIEKSCIVFSGIGGNELNEILRQMKTSGISIPLKAVCTQYNQSWTLAELVRELAREHEQMNGGGKGE